MKKLIFVLSASMILFLTACGGKSDPQTKNTDNTDTTQVEGTTWAEADTDSTIYGRADGFGQSAFTFIADDGKEYDVSLTSDSSTPQYGEIIGSRQDTARYALTLSEDREALVAMINLSQLDAITHDYEILNAHLALGTDGQREQVSIEELSDTLLRAKGISGKTYTLRRK